MSLNPRFSHLTTRELELKIEQHTRHYIESDDERFYKNIEALEAELEQRRGSK